MTAWWNSLGTYWQVVFISLSIPVLFVVIVSVLAVAHWRREKRERLQLEAVIAAEPLTPPGEFTDDELRHVADPWNGGT